MKNTITDYFWLLWLEKVDAELFSVLMELWAQPASVVGRRVNIERTKAYRHLMKMVDVGIVSTTTESKTTNFFIESLDGLERLVKKKTQVTDELVKQKDAVMDEMLSIARHDVRIPRVQTFQRPWDINHLFDDMMLEIERKWLLSIRLFASNTFEEQQAREVNKWMINDFFEALESKRVRVESYIWVGSLVMERIETWTHTHDLKSLPATWASIHIFVVWSAIYIVIYRDAPIGIKISGELIVDAFHALLDAAERGAT